tara:strand:+ start:12971 stop:13390 length:420 start_codon:yes stop_codon:yes gene_type:complete
MDFVWLGEIATGAFAARTGLGAANEDPGDAEDGRVDFVAEFGGETEEGGGSVVFEGAVLLLMGEFERVLEVRNTYIASRKRVTALTALTSDSMSGVLMLAAPGLTAAGDELRSEVFRLRSAGVKVRYAGSDDRGLANRR